MAHEDPSAPEDPLHLVGEDARVGVEGGVDAIVLHEGFVVDGGWRGVEHAPYSTGFGRP